jgi:hypothetical protein
MRAVPKIDEYLTANPRINSNPAPISSHGKIIPKIFATDIGRTS